ncbi:MAG TPA: GspH/FimT family pseudopilin [Steroidobacteraceae bacterium]|nr:GspH/FimT family pseudopilin [Steroidobacteraceae bacterium]
MKRMPIGQTLVTRVSRPPTRTPRARMSGVTLVELLAVIAIVAILLSIGVPSYQYITTSYRISSEANGLLGDLQFARVEAIKEGQTVTACVSSDGAHCAGADGWQAGWIVFSDVSDNQTVGAADTILRVQSAFTSTDTFDGTVTAVTFSRDGFALGLGTSGGATITLHNSTSNPNWTRCLELNVAGIMSIYTHTTQATCT